MDKKSSAHSVGTVPTVAHFRNYKAVRKEQGLKSR
jgi:hypothetical protein